MECWPRNVDITDPATEQYPGWPKTISQFDNYNPPSWGSLGELTFIVEDPVVQLIDAESNGVLYTVRANGSSFTPGAPEGKTFVVKACKNSPDVIVSENASVGSDSQSVELN